MPADSAQEVRAVVCDDDSVTRGVISDLLGELGGQVIAETDRAFDAIDLIERFEPGLVVCDLALTVGSGMDVIQFIAERGKPCQVVVFTAFEEMARPVQGVAVRLVSKPDFQHLQRALAAAIRDASDASGDAVVARERRRPVRTAARPSMRQETGLDEPTEFYRQLSEASRGDALLALSLGDADRADVVQALRKAIRVQDLVIGRHDKLIVLLVGGGAEGPPAVLRRLATTHPAIAEAATAAELDPAAKPPTEALLEISDPGGR